MHDTSSGRKTNSSNRSKSLFGRKPAHPGYAIKYYFTSVASAKGSARWALNKFHEEKNRDRKELIKYMTIFASSKAEAMSENHRLSPAERKKYAEMHQVYKKAYQQMVLPERHHTYEHSDKERHKKSHFPLHPHKGEYHTLIRTVKGRKRKLTFEATGHSGKHFGVPKWVIVGNEPL